jgi:hypothetical protein
MNAEDASAGGPLLVTNITVPSSTATKLPTVGLEYRRSIAIRNNGSSTIFLGHDDSVTTSNGFPLKATEIFRADITGNIPIWGITDAEVDIRIMELA